jgi:pantoate kinase
MNSQSSSIWGVPAHITGLFVILPNDDPLIMGSRGAGFSIENLIQTKITLAENGVNLVTYNEQVIDGRVSLATVEKFKESYTEEFYVKIEHTSQLPIQGGFGTSGAGALGTVFALNELLDTRKSSKELGQIAHWAEVTCKTGLGDVISQLQGNAEIRLEPGAPGIGVIKKFNWPIDQQILSIFLGKLSTKDIITNPQNITEINNTASRLLIKLQKDLTLEHFLDLSYLFAVKSGLLVNQIKAITDFVRTHGYKSSMIMLGGSIFVVDTLKRLKSCYNLVQNEYPQAKMWINPLATKGPRIIEKSQ